MTEALRIGELAARVGVDARTIRYYEEIGLLPAPRREPNGYRVYTTDAERRLRLIRGARALDFTLDEIREILALRDQGEAPCLYVLTTIDLRIGEVEKRISELQNLKRELVELREAAKGLPIDDVEGKECVCHLIQNQKLNGSLGRARRRVP